MTKSGATNDKRARQRVVVGHVPHLVADGARNERDTAEEEVVREEIVKGGEREVNEFNAGDGEGILGPRKRRREDVQPGRQHDHNPALC